MLRTLRSRRRPRYGAQVCCTIISAVLLLLSVSLLYSRLSTTAISSNDAITSRLLSDSSDSLTDFQQADDRIDELDIVEEESSDNRRLVNEEQDDEEEEQGLDRSTTSSNYFYDHFNGAIRKAFNRKSIEEWDDEPTSQFFGVGLFADDVSKGAFATDDLPVDDGIRRKLSDVGSVEDALLLKKVNKKASALREGWGDWFERKSDFLRKDRMFRSSLEVLHPMNNPLLQDPDGMGVTGFTRGDRLVQKWLLREFERSDKKKPPGDSRESDDIKVRVKGLDKNRSEIRKAERRPLDEMNLKKKQPLNENSRRAKEDISAKGNNGYSEFEGQIYADGKRWGYYPGLHPHLSFSDFVLEFFTKEDCRLRVFMVWNSPAWMFSVRHQRGLESLLVLHPDACVVVLSETIELNFFKDSFLKEGWVILQNSSAIYVSALMLSSKACRFLVYNWMVEHYPLICSQVINN